MDSRQCICWIAGAILFVLFIATFLGILLKRLTKHHNRKDSAMYYTEGTIDAIELIKTQAGTQKMPLRFSLLPSSAFLVAINDGKKKILFVDASGKSANLVTPNKNAVGKECQWFEIDVDPYLSILTAAKINHSQISVWCDDVSPADENHDSPVSQMKALGIRVF